MKKLALTLSAALLSATAVQAQNCAVPPSCEELGYTQTANDCIGMQTLKCPLDMTKMSCHPYPAEVGHYLYSDGRTSPIYNSKIGSVTGVIFDPANRKAIQYMDRYVSSEKWFQQWTPTDVQAAYKDNTPLIDYDSISYATNDTDGYYNSLTANAFYKRHYSTVFYRCTPTNTKLKAFVLSVGEWELIYDNLDKIDAALTKYNGTPVYRGYIWTSTEGTKPKVAVGSGNNAAAWVVNLGASGNYFSDKVSQIVKTGANAVVCGYLY